MPDDRRGKVMDALHKRGSGILEREDLFRLFPGKPYHWIEKLVKEVARAEPAVTVDWVGPNDFVLKLMEFEEESAVAGGPPPPPAPASQPLEPDVGMADISTPPSPPHSEVSPRERGTSHAEEEEYVPLHCPFLNAPCMGEYCAVYIDDEGCAIAVLAVRK